MTRAREKERERERARIRDERVRRCTIISLGGFFLKNQCAIYYSSGADLVYQHCRYFELADVIDTRVIDGNISSVTLPDYRTLNVKKAYMYCLSNAHVIFLSIFFEAAYFYGFLFKISTVFM